jgi:hypothetical protein
LHPGWHVWLGAIAVAAAMAAAPAQAADTLPRAIATLQKVGHDAAGNRAAAQAWPIVAAADATQLPTVLAALDDAGPLAANYLAAAIDTVAQRALAQGQKLPQGELERFVLDTAHAARSRRLAFEWLTKIDASAPDRLIPGFLNDPGLELRREAVARLASDGTTQVEKAAGDQSQLAAGIATLRRALAAARDLDQIAQLDKQLTDLKQEVDLNRHFGFITSWRLIGPFDNRNGIGFEAAYPPENGVDFAARYPGKKEQAAWLAHTTIDRHGKIDLNQALGKDMGCVGYAAVEFYSPCEREVDLRLGTQNASKLWLNGKLVGRHHVYHTGSTIDQYTSRATLQAGRNVILLKICQNEQKESWAQVWEFQFRVCDAIGTAIESEDIHSPGGPTTMKAQPSRSSR